MKGFLINTVLPQLLYIVIIVFSGLLGYYIKQFFTAKKDLIEKQKEDFIQKIGIDKYNQDVTIAKGLIFSVEQMAKEFDWESEVKHAKATELISNKTGLSTQDIYNIIKGTVAEINKDK